MHFHSTEQGRVSDGSETVKNIELEARKKADLIITVSYAMRDELIKLGCEERKIRVVYNGVDTEKYDPRKVKKRYVEKLREAHGIKENEKVILFIGRLTAVKGADFLLHAMKIISKEYENAKLIIIGKGEQEGMLMHLINTLGLKEKVIPVFRYITESERILYYALCDVACFPSKYEPFGIVCTEAMAMAKPVVVGARGTSGFREQVITSGEHITGFHINPYDPEDIAKFILEILKNEELAEKTLEVYEEAMKR